MTQLKKIMGFVTCGLTALAGLIAVIYDLSNIGNLKYFTGDLLAMQSIVLVVDIFVSVFILIFSTLVIVKNAQNKEYVNFIPSCLELYALGNIASVLVVIIFALKLAPGYKPSFATILEIILFALAVVLFLIGASKKGNLKTKKILSTVASSLMILAIIVCLIDSSGNGVAAATIFVAVLMLLAAISFIVCLYVPENEKTVTVQAKPAATIRKEPTQAGDPTEALIKLKKLYDSGAITKEEYEEKRKKYLENI